MTIHHASGSPDRLPEGPIPRTRVRAAYRQFKPSRDHKSNPRFISAEHAEFAQVLTQNGIAWLYKPRTFAIEWDSKGDLLDSITPDFYLPDYRQYVELATEEGTCLAAAARRLRLLSLVHPELDVRLIVGSNYLRAVERFIATGIWSH